MDIDPIAYVTAVGPANGFNFGPDQLRAVAEAFAVVIAIAAPALALTLPPELEPAPLYDPSFR